MLLLSPTYTDYPTNSGFQSVFQKDLAFQKEIHEALTNKEWSNKTNFNLTQWLLVLSIVWSMKTLGTTYVKKKAGKKLELLALPAKGLLALRSLLIHSVRLTCVVAYFGPFLGLLNTLAHWKAEQMILDPKVLSQSNISTVFVTDKSLPISLIHWADYSDPGNPLPPSYTLYTKITLGASFVVFIFIITIQGIANFILKMRLSQDFREAQWTSKAQHLLESVNCGDCFADWDDGHGSPTEYKKRWWNVVTETIVMIGVQFVTNLTLLIPLWVTSKMPLLF